MGLTFDSPIAINTGAYEKAHRPHQSNDLPLAGLARPISRKKSLLRAIGSPFRRSHTSTASMNKSRHPVPAKQSSFFRLPQNIREEIYAYVLETNQLLHILLKRHYATRQYSIAYRRCRANGDVRDCVFKGCKDFLDVANGDYFGHFDRMGGLLLSCRDIHDEACKILYQQNTLDFDHPLSLILLSSMVSPSSFQRIKSISINLQRNLYDHLLTDSGSRPISCPTFQPEQWTKMWEIIAQMLGLEEIRVKFKLSIDGWMGWTTEQVLEPLCRIQRPLGVFDVEGIVGSGLAVGGEMVPFNIMQV